MAALANIMDPTCVVIGGDMAEAGDLLLDAVRGGVRRHALGSTGTDLEVTVSSFADHSSLVGALLLAIENTELVLPSGSDAAAALPV